MGFQVCYLLQDLWRYIEKHIFTYLTMSGPRYYLLITMESYRNIIHFIKLLGSQEKIPP